LLRPSKDEPRREPQQLAKRTVRIKEDTQRTLPRANQRSPGSYSPRPPVRPLDQLPACAGRPKGAANVSLPSLFICQRSERSRQQPRKNGPND
jgi:hypothetical protein